jgi:hypothetical protein
LKLLDALLECTLPLLRRIAASHSVPAGDDTLRPELAGRLAETLLEVGYLDRYLAGLDEGELRILGEMAQSGWSAKVFVVDRLCPRKAGSAPPGKREPLSPCVSLLQRGLLYRGFGPIGDWRGELYYVPEEIQPALLQIAALPSSGPEVALKAKATPASEVQHDGAFDLFCLLSYLHRQPCRLSGERLARGDSERLDVECGRRSEVWSTGRAEDRWSFLVHLCLARGWVYREGRALRLGHTADRALAGGVPEIRSRLLDGYVGSRGWSDLQAAGRVRQLLGTRRIDEVAARKVVLHYIKKLCGDDWCDEAAFCEAIRSINPDFLREDYGSPGWAVVDILSGVELSAGGSWDAVEGEWLRYLLRGPLFWLGLVRWGISSGGLPLAFQLAGTDDNGNAEPIVVRESQAELRVTATSRCDVARLYRLERYMELQMRAGSSSYRLSGDTVLGAMEAGGTPEELVELLATLGGGTIRESVVEKVVAWATEYGRFTLQSSVLLSAETAADSAWVESLPGVASFLGDRLGDRNHRVIPERLWEVVAALKKADQLPRVDPSLRREVVRRLAADTALLRETLFALLVLRSVQPGVQLSDAATAIRKLEAALGPEEAEKVRARADEATKRLDKS